MSDSDHPVRTLWCIVDAEALPRIEAVASTYRTLGFQHAVADSVPTWASRFGNGVFHLGMRSGEYVGPVGASQDADTLKTDRDPDVIRTILRQKHPKWSLNKIERAVDSAISKSKPSRRSNLPKSAVEREALVLIGFLHQICEVSPVTLVLDDGGIVAPDRGGTRGVPMDRRSPVTEREQVVVVDEAGIDTILGIPLWTPVKFIRNR